MKAGRFAVGVLLAAAVWPVPAQDATPRNRGETERKLENIRRELRQVSAERRQIEGQRGDVTRQLRDAGAKLARSERLLRETEARLANDQQALAGLHRQRNAMQATLGAQRRELARLLRAAYAQGSAAPLKALLSHDSVAAANRTLVYHGYVQRDRVRRIAALSAQLRDIDKVEAEIVGRQAQLDRTRALQHEQLAQLQRDRQSRAALLAQLDAKYQDSRQREQTLGQDAKGLEKVLRELRAAARAEAQRRAAAEKAEREARRTPGATRPPARTSPKVAAPRQVGGAGWPLAGSLLAGYGGTMPDGRGSHGLLIAADAGAPVKAVADGSVVYAEWMTGYGLLLIIDHGNGYMSLYAHNDALLKDVGTTVKRGDAVATIGTSAGHGRPTLYFELRRDGQPVNPNAWLR